MKNKDSEKTKKSVKNLIAPRDERIQITSVRKVRNGGVAIEAASVRSASVIKEATKKDATLKVVNPRVNNPRLLVYDVEKDLEEREFKDSIYQQN